MTDRRKKLHTLALLITLFSCISFADTAYQCSYKIQKPNNKKFKAFEIRGALIVPEGNQDNFGVPYELALEPVDVVDIKYIIKVVAIQFADNNLFQASIYRKGETNNLALQDNWVLGNDGILNYKEDDVDYSLECKVTRPANISYQCSYKIQIANDNRYKPLQEIRGSLIIPKRNKDICWISYQLTLESDVGQQYSMRVVAVQYPEYKDYFRVSFHPKGQTSKSLEWSDNWVIGKGGAFSFIEDDLEYSVDCKVIQLNF